METQACRLATFCKRDLKLNGKIHRSCVQNKRASACNFWKFSEIIFKISKMLNNQPFHPFTHKPHCSELLKENWSAKKNEWRCVTDETPMWNPRVFHLGKTAVVRGYPSFFSSRTAGGRDYRVGGCRAGGAINLSNNDARQPIDPARVQHKFQMSANGKFSVAA